ncbi:Starch-binding associating with outer membrane [Chitinophaga terrae (ex Kim and Jung 2007)]|uniref:Starch-binding associating with outer membrane n=1 Tax=Chitinophaga terrae (ex Kim and Jung 2007) TaxID=408074 RepID=A0A1H3ZIX8_9BACT|nr:RagB/SusD family nutrient uptake outer membrane protein [Chitinophaga terrae (ex Kim and Jung 2007)]GEP88777.1 membrane protein [Chitinophaga terrae (ex Kim and Jung 2007)]SEA23625.1 Starch-binding associating with outer membrane [Chitinophaga terrae (ex Kim and Jung 2007)]
MKKLTLNILVALPLVLSTISCSKTFLDKTPPSALSSSVFWKSESDADLALTGLYSSLYASVGYATSQYTVMAWDNFSDDSYGQYNYGGGTTALTAGITPQSGDFVYSYYVNCYQAIASANSFLANVGKVLQGQKLDQYKAEAYFIRGFNYLWLAQLYGNVPIVTEDPFTLDFKSTRAKSPQSEVLKLVESDLDAAIANLPDKAYNDGHAVKATAMGYKLRALMLQQKWTDAAALAKQIIDGGKFSLYNNYPGNFYKPDQNSSPEIMFSVRYQLPNIQHQDVALAVHLQRWKGELGTQDLINEYEPGDPRKTMTFFFAGDTKAQGWPFTGDLSVATPGKDSWITGYYAVKKWLTPGLENPDYGALDDNDFVLLRYADVKLMYAEAQNEAAGPDASVYQQVNDVRSRPGVNMPPLPLGLSKDQMREKIRHERRVEFAMEGLRYHDLRRWGIAREKLNGFVPNPLFPAIKTQYADKYKFWPIPQTEIDRNQPALEQNPGY